MNKIFMISFIPLNLIISFLVVTTFISPIYGQIFEFNEDDYIGSDNDGNDQKEEKEEKAEKTEKNVPTTNSGTMPVSTDSEDTDKEPCIDGPLESSPTVELLREFDGVDKLVMTCIGGTANCCSCAICGSRGGGRMLPA